MTVESIQINRPATDGAPEGHEEAMIAKVDAVNAAAAEETTERPSWLPEQFATAEDMAKAYAELSSKQTPATPEVKTEAAPVAPAEATPEQAATELEAKGLDIADFTKEFNETGNLSAESYDKLLKAGYDKTLVDTYIAGQQALATQYETSVLNEAGGQDSYAEMVAWAKVNMTPAEQDAYNAAVGSRNLAHAKLAVAGLKAKFTADQGSEPNLLGGKTTAQPADVFESVAQVTEAMKDPRYQKDPAYRAAVQRKLGRSTVL